MIFFLTVEGCTKTWKPETIWRIERLKQKQQVIRDMFSTLQDFIQSVHMSYLESFIMVLFAWILRSPGSRR